MQRTISAALFAGTALVAACSHDRPVPTTEPSVAPRAQTAVPQQQTAPPQTSAQPQAIGRPLPLTRPQGR